MNWADEERGKAEPRFNQIFVLPIARGVQCSPPTWIGLGLGGVNRVSPDAQLVRVAVRGHTGVLLHCIRLLFTPEHGFEP
jgi:hypothetical protein